MLPTDRGAGPAVASLGKATRDPKDGKKIKKMKKKKMSDKGAQEEHSAGGSVAPNDDNDADGEVVARGANEAKKKAKAKSRGREPAKLEAAAAADADDAAEGPVAVEDEGPLPQTFAELGLDVQLCEACKFISLFCCCFVELGECEFVAANRRHSLSAPVWPLVALGNRVAC